MSAKKTKKPTIKELANQKLLDAFEKAQKEESINCSFGELIDYVIDGTHLTYKYVLFNALLSKATDETLNPLCLQKKSILPGSFDARTVCHKVIVPFEQTTLKKILGGSNEPFLNKPARYTELSKENAVRKGKDKQMLFRLCDELPKIKTSKEAFNGLVYLLQKLLKLVAENEYSSVFSIPNDMNLPINLMNFAIEALKQNFEGQVLTLIVAGIYHLLYHSLDAFVEVHPVNESGASSKEVSDLDIYLNEKLIISNELKDKVYYESDVRHAVDKVLNNGGTKMFFIEGPRADCAIETKRKLVQEYAERNFMLVIIPYNAFLANVIPLIENIDCHEYMRFILQTAHETKFKKEVIEYLDSVAQHVLGLKHLDK